MSVTSALIVFIFTQRMIEEKDFRRFLKRYDPTQPEAWHYLPNLSGRMLFSFEGFDEGETSLIDIPTARQFMKAFHGCWPYWTFFCDLTQEDLRVMTFACLDTVKIVYIPGQRNWGLAYDRDELDRFLEEDFKCCAERLRGPRTSERTIGRRIQAVRDYFRGPLHERVFRPSSH